MKKLITFSLLTLICFSAFAEENWRDNRRQAIHFDPLPLVAGTLNRGFGLGFGFEHSINPQISVKGKLHYIGMPSNEMFWRVEEGGSYFHSIRLQAEGRWYPLTNSVRGLFANGGLQFQRGFGSFTIVTTRWDSATSQHVSHRIQYNGSNSLGFYLGLGHKFIIGNNRFGLLIEPTLDFIHSVNLGSSGQYDFLNNNMITSVRGFRFGLNFGAAF